MAINDNFIAPSNTVQWPVNNTQWWNVPVTIYPFWHPIIHSHFYGCQCAACRPQVMPYYTWTIQPDPKVAELEKRVEELEKRLSKRGK